MVAPFLYAIVFPRKGFLFALQFHKNCLEYPFLIARPILALSINCNANNSQSMHLNIIEYCASVFIHFYVFISKELESRKSKNDEYRFAFPCANAHNTNDENECFDLQLLQNDQCFPSVHLYTRIYV